jgi:cadmium-exporting ATPase
MKKKKEIIIAISAILFTLTLFIRMPQALQLILILVAYVLVGKDTVLLAVKKIERGDFLDENFLMTVATLGAILIGEYPEAVAVMLLYEIGELFQGYAINKSRKSIAAMMDIKPEYANVIRDNKTQRVDPDEVELGEIIEIRPGERVPLDATIIKGETSLDTSAFRRISSC